jgi:hypothetical protein
MTHLKVRAERPCVDPIGVFDDPRYAALALASRDKYKNGDPFPHVVFDDFLATDLAVALGEAFPHPEENIDWVNCDHENASKKYQHDETKLPVLIRKMLREFNSRQFILFLETLTGIDNLIPDPYFIGGGAHVSGSGSYLKVHADFNWHDKLLLHRRLNALLYLNENWDKGWGGALELWDKGMTRPVQSIQPIMNRLLVFSTTEDSNHGHPHPLAVPKGVHRQTLNLYFYTSKRDEAEINAPHFTMYKTQSPFALELSETYRQSALKAERRSE